MSNTFHLSYHNIYYIGKSLQATIKITKHAQDRKQAPHDEAIWSYNCVLASNMPHFDRDCGLESQDWTQVVILGRRLKPFCSQDRTEWGIVKKGTNPYYWPYMTHEAGSWP